MSGIKVQIGLKKKEVELLNMVFKKLGELKNVKKSKKNRKGLSDLNLHA